MSNNKTKSKCDGAFAMSPKAHLGGCGCPECAVEENSNGTEAGIQDVINCLRTLAEAERLLVWDPVSKRCLSGADIENVCANGNSVQISLSKAWAEENANNKKEKTMVNEHSENESVSDPNTHSEGNSNPESFFKNLFPDKQYCSNCGAAQPWGYRNFGTEDESCIGRCCLVCGGGLPLPGLRVTINR